jgi:hypothetical protein
VNLWRKGRSAALTLMIPSQHLAPSGSWTNGVVLGRDIVNVN